MLGELDVGGIPLLTCWNKLDACADPAGVRAVAMARPGTACVSSLTGEGMEDFLAMVEAAVADLLRPARALLPFHQVCMRTPALGQVVLCSFSVRDSIPLLHRVARE